ncbi:putative S-adenosyl-L-methionine-dependent methyltransferase [Dioscorea sansibarensis]
MMAFGRNSRMDTRRNSSYCSTATMGVFVALCLVGVWMMTSSTIVPGSMSSTGTNSEIKHQVSETGSKQFEDNQSDLPEDAIKGDTSDANTSTNEPDPDSTLKDIENSANESNSNDQAENAAKVDKGANDSWDDTSKSQTYNDVNGKAEGGEASLEGGKSDSDGHQISLGGEGQDKNLEQNSGEKNIGTNSDEAANNAQEKSVDQSLEGSGDNVQEKNMKQGSDGTTNNAPEKNIEQNSDATGDNMEDKNIDQSSDEPVNNAEDKNMKQNSDVTESSTQENSQQNSDEDVKNEREKQSGQNFDEATSNEMRQDGKIGKDEMGDGQINNTGNDNQDNSGGNNVGNKQIDQAMNEVFPDGAQSELLKETNTQNGAWSTQATESKNEREAQISSSSSSSKQSFEFTWKLCNSPAGTDYIPCLDNDAAIKKLKSTKHYEHRERHCPEEAPTCLVPLPDQYRRSIEWPKSRGKVWYHNVPHTALAEFKGHQNWVKVSGEYLTFPGGGTQFKNGALHYIDKIQEALPDIAWGKQSRVVLDVGCGVASFGGYLFDRDVITMSFAPKDEHEAQVQFALERGIPAFSGVMGTKRLPFPSRVFDVIHCARCRVPWHIEGGMLLLELNRLLRPGGYFVWSATPVYQNIPEDVDIWKAMSALTKAMCWDLLMKTKDKLNRVGIAIYRKPLDNTCYDKRKKNSPPLCQESDDPNAAWNVPLQACMHRLPTNPAERGSRWPVQWPLRLETTPYWLNSSQTGVYGKPAPEDFTVDYAHWKYVVSNSYLNGMGINWGTVRNVMDMRAVYGGFAAALRDMKVWVMNIISIDAPDTLPIIYERGLFGMYHDWCESFSTYPRSYDLLHADHLFSNLRKRCKLLPVMAEVDRILRPEGKLIVRDKVEIINEIENMAKSLHWEVRLTFSKESEGLMCLQKTSWRPKEVDSSTVS